MLNRFSGQAAQAALDELGAEFLGKMRGWLDQYEPALLLSNGEAQVLDTGAQCIFKVAGILWPHNPEFALLALGHEVAIMLFSQDDIPAAARHFGDLVEVKLEELRLDLEPAGRT